MTVTAQDLEDYSPFRVSETDAATDPTAITTTTFLKYAALVKIKLDRDNPGLSTEEYDHAQALLIAHEIAAKEGGLEKTQARLDNYSYSKESGVTSFLVQYKTLIEEAREYLGEKPTQLIAHADTALGSLKMDQAPLPQLFDPDDVDGEAEDP